MYCIFDTETTGLFDFSRPADAPGQPRLASIAMLACDDELRLRTAVAVVVRPDGWEMPPEAESINGLTTAFLFEHGVPVGEVLTRYADAIASGETVVAHNAQYDTKIMRGEFRRAGMADLYGQTRSLCTMKALTDVCRIPKARGGEFKWPKLSEAVQHCLGREHTGAHGALADAMACLELLRWLKTNGLLPAAEIAGQRVAA